MFEHEVLPAEDVRRELGNFTTAHVDVDASPLWMDIPGFQGLPTLAFFDSKGRHVLTRSGHRDVSELILLLETVRTGLATGEIEPYPGPPAPRKLTHRALTSEQAAAELTRHEKSIYMQVNSNDGGFYTPARHPFPGLLVEMQRWQASGGAPDRVDEAIELTITKALRGRSPRLAGEPLDDMDFGAEELQRLSEKGPEAGPRWREGIDRLPDADPYLGLQDPHDYGVFRYAAGPGWYNPHYERRALENLAWAELLKDRRRRKPAKKIARFVEETFAVGELLAASQRADPFYYRLTPEERAGIPAPRVAPQLNLHVQARAARVNPKRCATLLEVGAEAWPKTSWTADGEDETSGDAPPDAVGELLTALSRCPGKAAREHGAMVADLVLARWQEEGFAAHPRLFGLAIGVCAVRPEDCARALAATEGLDTELAHPPPLAELAAIARSEAQ